MISVELSIKKTMYIQNRKIKYALLEFGCDIIRPIKDDISSDVNINVHVLRKKTCKKNRYNVRYFSLSENLIFILKK